MNHAQIKYLIDKITEKVKNKIKELESQKKEFPSIEQYMMHEILSNKFEIKSNEELRKIVIEKAKKGLSSSRPDNFLGDSTSWTSSNKNKIILKFEDFFNLSSEYQNAFNDTKIYNNELNEQIRLLQIQSESLETRIMLASDKTLQKMINEVDDMGDISLIDTKIKLLN
jgi:hypothetical protein